jgi:hypothetical protein
MFKKKPSVDVTMDILKAAQSAYPSSKFIESLIFQYQERGGLSKRQLQGLYDKATKVEAIPPGKLATLEAIILKKVTRYKSPQPSVITEQVTRDTTSGELIEAILQKYPQHKRVLFYKAKFDNNEDLFPAEKAELDKFKKLLL